MLDIVSTTPAASLTNINPTVQAMLDIVLAKAADGEPTMDDDFADFTPDQIKTHMPAVKRLADKIVVRQLGDDNRSFETRAALLRRCAGLIMGRMPSEADMHMVLRSHGVGNTEIADIWSDLITCAGQAFVTSRLPAPEAN